MLQDLEERDEHGDPMDVEGAEIIDQPTQPSDKPRITTRYMTKYERARILGTRALQIRSADEHSNSSRVRTFSAVYDSLSDVRYQ